MPKVKIRSESLRDIADAVRQKAGRSVRMYLHEIPDEMNYIPIEDKERRDAAWILRTLKTAFVPDGVENIADRMFQNMKELVSAELPDSVVRIGGSAFENCTNLFLQKLPAKLTVIGDGAFYQCKNLVLTELPSGLRTIGRFAFGGCSKLAIKTIPSSVERLDGDGRGTFDGCIGLTVITFLGTPTFIVGSAFRSCGNLKVINVPWAEGEVAGAPWGAVNATINYNHIGERYENN